MYLRKHFVLRAGGRHHSTDGPQFYCKQANVRHNKHDGKGQTTLGLPRDTSGCNHTVLSIEHGFKRPFGCILPLRDESTYTRVRPFLHGMDPQGRRSDQVKWGIFYIVYHPSFCCGFGGRGRTRRSLPQLQRRNNILTHPGRNRASPAEDIGALRQCHSVGNANNTVKMQQSQSMEMRYFLVGDKEAQDIYDIKWHPGQNNLADIRQFALGTCTK